MSSAAVDGCVVNYEKGRCELIGAVDFHTARTTLDAVVQHMSNAETLDIDLQQVSRSNSAMLALLIEWQAYSRRSGCTVRFHHIPDGIRQLASVCQVDGLL